MSPPGAIAFPWRSRTQGGQFGARALRIMARNWLARFCAGWAALRCLWQVPGIESGGGVTNKLLQPPPETHLNRAQGPGDGGDGIAARRQALRNPFLARWNMARIGAKRGLQRAGPVRTDKGLDLTAALRADLTAALRADLTAALRADLTAALWADLTAALGVLGEVKLGSAEGQKESGPVAYLCRSKCSFRPPCVRKPRGFPSLGLSDGGGGYRIR